MSMYKVRVNNNEYTVRILEDRGSSILVDVNGKQVLVEVAQAAQVPEAVSKPAEAVAPPAGREEKEVTVKQETAPQPTTAPVQPTIVPTPTPAPAGVGVVVSKVPGKVLKVFVSEGQSVQENQTVLTMESMKMEIEIKSPKTGRVSKILVKPGDYVEPGQQMMFIE
jgi:biotin carboxyl carrier protein